LTSQTSLRQPTSKGMSIASLKEISLTRNHSKNGKFRIQIIAFIDSSIFFNRISKQASLQTNNYEKFLQREEANSER
jgi:hypothetical protein